MKTKTILRFLTTWIVLNIISYVYFAFIFWEANPALWDKDARVAFAIVGTILIGFVSLGITLNIDDK